MKIIKIFKSGINHVKYYKVLFMKMYITTGNTGLIKNKQIKKQKQKLQAST